MKNPNFSGWKCQSEQMISGQDANNSHMIDQLIGEVTGLGLDPAQAERIHEAILAVVQEPTSLTSQNNSKSTVLVRLLVPVMGLEDPPCPGQEDQAGHRKGSNGPGFFIFEKKVGGQGNLHQAPCREVNVLIYGHSHSR